MAEKTIEQLAGGQQGMPVSTAMGQGQGIQAPRYQVGERLAEDLLGAIGEAGRVAHKVYDASVEGAKRIAMDKSEEMAMHIEHVKQFYNENDPDHLRAMEADIAMKFMELSNEKFTLHDAQLAFDNVFTKPVGVSTAKLSTTLKKEEIRLDNEWNNAQILDGTLSQYRNFLPVGAEQFDTYIDIMTSLEGEPAREGAMLNVAKTATQAFDTRVKTSLAQVLSMSDYDPNVGLDNATKKRIFEDHFGDAYGYLDEESGEIVWREKFDSEVGRDEILRSWSTFLTTLTKGKGSHPVNERYFNAMARGSDVVGNSESQYVPSQDIKAEADVFWEEIQEANKEIPLSDTEWKNAKIKYADYLNSFAITSIIEDDLNVAVTNANGTTNISHDKINQAKDYMDEGRLVKVQDAHTGLMKELKISPENYKKIYESQLSDLSTKVMNVQIDDEESSQVFMAGLSKLAALESIGQKQSVVSQKYEPILESDTVVPPLDSNGIKQFMAYESFRGMTDYSRENNTAFVDTLKTELAKLERQELKPADYERAYVNTFTNLVTEEKQSRKGVYYSKELDREIRTVIDEMVAKGHDRWGLVWDAEPAMGMQKSLKMYATNKGGVGSLGTMMDKIEFVDYGRWTFTTLGAEEDQRAFRPDGLSEKETVDALDSILDFHNNTYKKDYDRDEVRLENVYDTGTRTFKIIVRDADNTSKILGSVTSYNGKIMKDILKDDQYE